MPIRKGSNRNAPETPAGVVSKEITNAASRGKGGSVSTPETGKYKPYASVVLIGVERGS